MYTIKRNISRIFVIILCYFSFFFYNTIIYAQNIQNPASSPSELQNPPRDKQDTNNPFINAPLAIDEDGNLNTDIIPDNTTTDEQSPTNLKNTSLFRPHPDSPAPLFSSKLGFDISIDIFTKSTWLSQFAHSFGIAITPQKENSPYTLQLYPSIPFTNTITSETSIWLMRTWYFSFMIADAFHDNNIAIGYKAIKKDSVIQQIRFANYNIGLLYTAPYIPNAAQNDKSFGATITLQSSISKHELALLYETSIPVTRTYYGTQEQTKHTNNTMAHIYQRHLAYRLPHKNITALHIYAAQKTGSRASDGYSYELLEDSHYYHDNEHGMLYIIEHPKTRIIIDYIKNSTSFITQTSETLYYGIDASDGAPNLQQTYTFNPATPTAFETSYLQPFNTYYNTHLTPHDYMVQLHGKTMLIIDDPALPNPFAHYGYYVLPYANQNSHVSFVDTQQGITENLQYAPLVNTKFSAIYSSHLPLSYYDYPYPLAFIHTRYRQLYTAMPLPQSTAFIYSAHNAQNMVPQYNLVLGENIVHGSVHVIKNGAVYSDYTIDYEKNSIIFATAIMPSDVLHITYRQYNNTIHEGRLLATQTNRFFWDARNILNFSSINIGTSININKKNYSTFSGEHEIQAGISTETHFNTDSIRARLQAGGLVYGPNTTHYLRLLDMSSFFSSIALNANVIAPSSVPHATDLHALITTQALLPTLPTFTQQSRGRLRYYNYRNNNSYNSYTQTLDSQHIIEYENNQPTGPYLVYNDSSDSLNGLIAGFTYEIDGAQSWVGGNISLHNYNIDISQVNTLRFQYQSTIQTGSILLFVQIGAIGEDLDEYAHTSTQSDEGFPFYDAGSQKTLISNWQNAHVTDADFNKNNVIDHEEPSSIITHYITRLSPSTTTDWHTVNISFSDHMRSRLTNVRSLRIIAVRADTQASFGTLLIGQIQTHNESVSTQHTTGQIITSQENDSHELQLLQDRFPILEKKFSIATEHSPYLAIKWSNVYNKTWSIYQELTQFPVNYYEKLSLHIKTQSLDAPVTAHIRLYNNEHTILAQVSWEITRVHEWTQFQFQFDNGVFTQNDGTTEHIIAQFSPITSYHTINAIELHIDNSENGTIFFDEVYASEPRTQLSGGIAAHATFMPQWNIQKNNIHILTNTNISMTARLQSPHLLATYANHSIPSLFSYNAHMQSTLVHTALTADFSLELLKNSHRISGAHSITFPFHYSGPFAIRINYFTRYNHNNIVEFMRSTIGIISIIPSLFNTQFSYHINMEQYNTNILQQKWTGRIQSSFPFPLSIQATSTLTIQTPIFSNTHFTHSYFKNWIHSIASITKTITPFIPTIRTGIMQAHIAFTPSFIQPKIAWNSTSIANETNNTLIDTHNISLIAPMQISPIFSLKAQYKRNLHNTSTLKTATIITDISTSFSHIAIQKQFLTSIPFIEFFTSNGYQEFQNNSTSFTKSVLNSELQLQMTRNNYNYSWIDIFIPFSLNLTLNRTYHKILHNYFNTSLISMTTTALSTIKQHNTIQNSLHIAIGLNDLLMQEWQIEHILSFTNNTFLQPILKNHAWSQKNVQETSKIIALQAENLGPFALHILNKLYIMQQYNAYVLRNDFTLSIRYSHDVLTQEQSMQSPVTQFIYNSRPFLTHQEQIRAIITAPLSSLSEPTIQDTAKPHIISIKTPLSPKPHIINISISHISELHINHIASISIRIDAGWEMYPVHEYDLSLFTHAIGARLMIEANILL